MLKEAFDLLFSNAVKAAGVMVTRIDGDPTRVIVSQNGERSFEGVPHYRKHVVNSLDSFILAVARYCVGGTVWHSADSVIAVCDDELRRDFVTLPLAKSAQFLSLASLKSEGLAQREFIRLLRHDLAGCTDGTLLPLVRKVEFKSGSSNRAEIEKGRESLGRSVDAAISVTQDLPDLVVVSVPVYSTEGVNGRVEITCSLDVNLQTERFVMLPLPNQLQDAIDDVQSGLHATLDESQVPVFYGTP